MRGRTSRSPQSRTSAPSSRARSSDRPAAGLATLLIPLPPPSHPCTGSLRIRCSSLAWFPTASSERDGPMNPTSPPRPQKAAMLVAQRIVRDALRDNLRPGDLLIPEREMLEKYQTGRGTLREALRLLEVQGVIALKPGPRGGPVLRTPDGSHLASTFVLLMQLHGAPYRTIVEVRTALEPVISSLAAQRIGEECLDELNETVDRMHRYIDEQEPFFEANRQFHDIIARASGNALFAYMIDS